MSEIQEISISSLFVDERNVRHGDDVDVENLAEDIEENGVIQPIVVRPDGDGYGVVAGSRRFKASKKAGLDSMPCIVRDLDDDRAVALSVLENHSREDVEPRDQVKAIERYFEESDRFWTDKDKRDKLTKPVSEGGFGFPQGTANDYLSILNVDKEVREEYNLACESDTTKDSQKQLDVSKARKVGREMSDYPAEDQEKVIEEIEEKTFQESKEIIEEVSAKVENQEAENVQQALDMVEMQDREQKKVIITNSLTEDELREKTDKISSNRQLSNLEKIVSALNLELPKGFDLSFSTFNNDSAKEVYGLYLSVCSLKGKYPEFIFNSKDVLPLRKIRDYAKRSGSDLSVSESLEKWGELSISGELTSDVDLENSSDEKFVAWDSNYAGKSKESVYEFMSK